MTQINNNVPLASYTSFGVGGNAERFVEVKNTEELLEVLAEEPTGPIWLLSYGSNTLISDTGLQGLTICLRGGSITTTDQSIIVDAGVWWDDVVVEAISRELWGIELLSEVPGSVGAAVFINIAAYGQSIGSRVTWVEAWDTSQHRIRRFEKNDLVWGYKQSIFQQPEFADFIILRVCLELSDQKTDELGYQKALDVATELGLASDNLADRRKIIIEARKRAGSLWHPQDTSVAKSVGSFFRNPLVSPEQAENIIRYDESGKTAAQIKQMNTLHGGSSQRVSAAHVMLAAGFKRGQRWEHVKLHDQNLLKIEALGGATAQEIHDVMELIQKTCEEKLGIKLEPEARLLGAF